MKNSANIFLKSGRNIIVEDFKYITYPTDNGGHETVKEFQDFYLYDKLLTFVGGSSIVTLNSTDIETIKFSINKGE